MPTDPSVLWQRYQQHLCVCEPVGLSLDISRIDFDDDFFKQMQPAMDNAYAAMTDLENGAIANPDEKRMVGHYWLRASKLAPDQAITRQIDSALTQIRSFAADVQNKHIKPPSAQRFTDLLIVGIGGSALGPQLIADALGSRNDAMDVHFFDNTDPDGFDRVIARIGPRLKSTMVLVISKSGGTKETRNGMLEIQHAFTSRKLDFRMHAVAITGQGSKLDHYATDNLWLAHFPMWDWVGGRTSVLSAVGLLPAALQGIDIDNLLAGAAAMDQITRQTDTAKNPAALLALMWHHATSGRGQKDMVILPYKDRLILMSRYLQQLVMESLGKQNDLDGNPVNQGIAVYGNKGSTDQHAYVQQLREGVNNFFATFIVVLQDRQPTTAKRAPDVEPNITSGDFLNGFWQGTRKALYENGRGSITITLNQLNPHAIGSLIALYERAVGLYATLININAYHQPGVEAGKVAAEQVLTLQEKVITHLKANPGSATADQIATAIGNPAAAETVHHILTHQATNNRGITHEQGRFAAE